MKTEANCFLVYDAALDGSIRHHKSEFFSGWFLERMDCSCIAVAELLNAALVGVAVICLYLVCTVF